MTTVRRDPATSSRPAVERQRPQRRSSSDVVVDSQHSALDLRHDSLLVYSRGGNLPSHILWNWNSDVHVGRLAARQVEARCCS